MEIWKNKQIGKITLNGNSAMIDTEGVKNGGGIYQIAIMIFNENGKEIKSKTWYIKETISSNIQMHNASNHSKDKGVYKKLLKIVNQKNAQTTVEQVKKSIKRFLQKNQVKNIIGQNIFRHDLPLIRYTFNINHIHEWLEMDLKYYDVRYHYQRVVDYNSEYEKYTIKKENGRYSVNELSKYFLNKKEKHTAINDCKIQLELLNMLKIA